MAKRRRTRTGLAMLAVAASSVLLAVGVASGASVAPADAPERTAPSQAGGAETADASLLPSPPTVSADAWMVFNVDQQTVVGGREIKRKRAIASLTKLMTALVVVEETARDDEVTVSRAATRVGGASGELEAGATYSVAELMDAMLAASANDAAHALAEHVSGSVPAFVEEMNRRAVRLELENTTFSTVTGLDTPGNGSNASDLLKLAQAAMQEPRIAGVVGQEQIRLSVPGGVSKILPNRNPLIGTYPGVDGIKTGFTDDAGYCLMLHYVDEQSGSEYYIVLLGSDSEDSRESDGRAMLDWVRKLRPEVLLAEAGDVVARAPVAYSGQVVDLVLAEDVRSPMLIGTSLQERIAAPMRLRPPLQAGDAAGTYELVRAGEVVASAELVLAEDVSEPAPKERLRWYADHLGEAWTAGTDFLLSPLGLAGTPE